MYLLLISRLSWLTGLIESNSHEIKTSACRKEKLIGIEISKELNNKAQLHAAISRHLKNYITENKISSQLLMYQESTSRPAQKSWTKILFFFPLFI